MQEGGGRRIPECVSFSKGRPLCQTTPVSCPSSSLTHLSCKLNFNCSDLPIVSCSDTLSAPALNFAWLIHPTFSFLFFFVFGMYVWDCMFTYVVLYVCTSVYVRVWRSEVNVQCALASFYNFFF